MTTGKFYAMIDDMVGAISEQLQKHGAFQTDAGAIDVLTDIGEDLEYRLGWLLEEEHFDE